MRTGMTGHRARGGASALALSLALATSGAGLAVAKEARAAEFTLKFGVSAAEDAEHTTPR